jgi:desulfoferrodoxin (superoxide reductase-like protein)
MKLGEKRKQGIFKTLEELGLEKEVVTNSIGDPEKHIPECIVMDDTVIIKVNHVMEVNHYIEWILVQYEDMEIIRYYKPEETIELQLSYQKNMKVYAYCNKHGLWVNDNIK